jgi:hypothetical protein
MSQLKTVTSLKKVLANRNNAKKSTGPRTENGKAWAKRNAVKHGLRAEHIITVGENKIEFEELKDQFVKELQPIDIISMQLVNRIVLTAWNLQRSDKIQSGMLAYEMLSYEADEYKSKLKEIHHADFAGSQIKVPYQNLLMGLSFLRDCNSSNAMVKLVSYETRMLNRYSQLLEQLKKYKEQKYER